MSKIAIIYIVCIVGPIILLFVGGWAAAKTIELIRKTYIARASHDESAQENFNKFFEEPGLEVEIGYVERIFLQFALLSTSAD